MDYVRKFLHVDGLIGQGAFGRVLITSPLQNQSQVLQTAPITNRQKLDICTDVISSKSKQNGIDGNQTPLKQHLPQRSPKQIGSKIINQTDSNGGTRFALKCVYPIIKPQRLASELRHLRDLGGQCNIVQMHAAHFNSGSLFIVMELIEHDKFLSFVAQLTFEEIVIYMKNLLIALEHVHKKGIMHRDIKPSNFLYNRKLRKFLLVDFGLAQVIRTKPPLQVNRQNGTPNSSNFVTPISLLNSPTTTTTSRTTNRRIIAPLFPELHEKQNDKSFGKINQSIGHQQHKIPSTPFVNLKSTHMINSSPARHYINLTPAGSPSTPNVSTKRNLPELHNTNDFNQMLKKLRVSGIEERRESVRLTVGAYESPVTNNDSNNRCNTEHRFSTPIAPNRIAHSARCDCRGRPQTCTTCMSRPDSNAPRSGTPGYKAPELLFRYNNQTSAIDIWSAGVIFACLISGHSPFFREVDDNTSLAEIITILGSKRVCQAARMLNIRLIVEPKREPIDLVKLCKNIRLSNKDKLQIDIPDTAFDLLLRMLDPNPMSRITATEALEHPFFESLT